MTADFDPQELVAHVQCGDCGQLVPKPWWAEPGMTWRCYACGWGSMPNLDTE